MSRARRKLLTAIGPPSLTGEWLRRPLVQRLNSPREVTRASSPASRMTISSASRNSVVSVPGNGQALQPYSGGR